MATKTITKKENARREREDSIYVEAPADGVCERCKKPGQDLYQHRDNAWCCNKCQWTRKDFGGEVQQHNTIQITLAKMFGVEMKKEAA